MKSIPLYLGFEHDCDYLPGHRARLVYVSPDVTPDRSAYSSLARNGFRRSGDLVYRPHCSDCSSCVPMRIPVDRFLPNRAQRRTARRNADLNIVRKPAEFDKRHFALYLRYLRARHGDGHMASSTQEDYIRFVTSEWGDTGLYEFLRGEELYAVAVVDHLDDGLSAVYTFFDPRFPARSLGTFAVLWQIREARRLGRDWVYLGFWVPGCRKMAYKSKYRPFQAFCGREWVTVDSDEAINL